MGRWLSKFQAEKQERGLLRTQAPNPCETAGEGTDRTDKRGTEDIATLRSHLAGLRRRIDKGFEVLRAREDAGKTGRPYPLWLETWEKLVQEYEQTADKLGALAGCPVGDCHLIGTCNLTTPAKCPAVHGGRTP